MDFPRYADAAAALLNADLDDVSGLRAHLYGRETLAATSTDRDCMVLRRFQRELRPVFAAAAEDRSAAVVAGLNALMAHHPITPQIGDEDPADLHIRVAMRTASVAELLIGESLLGLAHLVCELGPTRLGLCDAERCDRVYVDVSANHSRRYCSERCSSRANVAAYRARRRAAAPA